MGSKIRLFIDQYWILIILLVVKFILQYILVNPVYELHRDEFLHLGQANHLSFGYISVPPFTSWISKIIYLLGGSIFFVRFFPALFGVLTIVFAWLLVERLGGKLFSKILVACALVFSVMMRLNILFQPNSFEILAWTIIFYLLVTYIKTEQPKYVIYCAFVIVLGFYNKYNIAFPLIGLLVGFLVFPQRKLFTDKIFWKALIIILVLVLPNVIWQFIHHLPVIHHMQRLKETQLDNNSILGFLKGQLVFFFGSLPLIIAALIAFVHYKPFRPYRFIGIAFTVAIVLFALLKAKDYYAAGLYPALLAFGSVYIEKLLGQGWKIYIGYVLILVNLALFIMVSKYLFPVLQPVSIVENKAGFERFGMLRWEDGKNHALPQDFADMLGWKEVAQKSLAAYNMISVNEKDQTLVFCDNYGQTGALNYYNRNKMPEAYSFNTDYIFWLPRMVKIKNVLLVGNKPSNEILALFKNCNLFGVVENEYARENGTGIYLLTGAKDEFTSLFYQMADKRIAQFNIF